MYFDGMVDLIDALRLLTGTTTASTAAARWIRCDGLLTVGCLVTA